MITTEKPTLTVSKSHDEQQNRDRAYWKDQTPEARLNQVELLRLESGKFLYEYPARLRRVITITRKS